MPTSSSGGAPSPIFPAHRPRLKGTVPTGRAEDGTPHPRGVIDFGDAVHSWRVNDVAIAMAYVMVCICNPENKRSGFAGDAAESLLAAAHFLHGFETCARPCALSSFRRCLFRRFGRGCVFAQGVPAAAR